MSSSRVIRKVLVINSGSSSLKFMLFDMNGEKMLCKGLVERIGSPNADLVYNRAGESKVTSPVAAPNHGEALKAVCAILADPERGVLKSLAEVDAIGHRVLHAAEKFAEPVKVNAAVKAAVKKCSVLGPLHNPANLEGICACERVFKGVPNVAVFDTAFHQTMPACAYRYALPKSLYTKYGVRKYGFHGTSHKYVAVTAAAFLKKPLAKLNLVTCHLGNGSSLAAIHHGRVVDTSMGLTPLAGLVMGTRSGNVDAGAVLFVARQLGLSIEQLDRLLNKESGLQGLTGVKGGDMRDICTRAAKGDKDCQEALEIFGHRAAFYVGAYNTISGGADAIIMTGGIGENSDVGREQIVKRLGALGVKLNKAANRKCHGTTAVISTPDSKIPVIVIPTNEELMIARETFSVLNGK